MVVAVDVAGLARLGHEGDAGLVDGNRAGRQGLQAAQRTPESAVGQGGFDRAFGAQGGGDVGAERERVRQILRHRHIRIGHGPARQIDGRGGAGGMRSMRRRRSRDSRGLLASRRVRRCVDLRSHPHAPTVGAYMTSFTLRLSKFRLSGVRGRPCALNSIAGWCLCGRGPTKRPRSALRFRRSQNMIT